MEALMPQSFDPQKRRLVGTAGLVLLGGLAPLTFASPAFAEEKTKNGGGEEEVTPPEDLMREHGVLDRVLLIYEAAMRKLAAREDFDAATLTQSAEVVRDF